MYRHFLGALCFAVAVLLLEVVAGEMQLRQSVVISRHGSRTLLKKDHRTFAEPKNSQLTVRGMNQMFRAGKFARSHFNRTDADFLSMVYDPSEIYVRFSDYSRKLNRFQSTPSRYKMIGCSAVGWTAPLYRLLDKYFASEEFEEKEKKQRLVQRARTHHRNREDRIEEFL